MSNFLVNLLKAFFIICNYVLDLIYERTDILKQISNMNYEQIYFLLKGSEFEAASRKKITKRITPCLNNFHSFGHHLSGANFHVFNYHDERVKELIWQMKFNDNKKVAKIFGYCLYRNLHESGIRSKQLDDFFKHCCLLIPTPIHRKRLFERGYNQCDWLCKEMIKNLNDIKQWNARKRVRKDDFNFKINENNFNYNIIYAPGILKRIKYSKKQSWTKNSNRVESTRTRNKNIENVFSVNQKKLNKFKDSNIILIDDVFTTGATINEASRTLRTSGSQNIISFTVAR